MFDFGKVSHGIQAMVGGLAAVVGALASPDVLHLLPAKVATPLTIIGVIVAALSHPPRTPLSGQSKNAP